MAWLPGWDKRIELKIEDYAGDIGASVTWFPVTVFLTATQGEEVFTELTTDAEYLKVAFTKADGTTQLYGEKELFAHYVSKYPPEQSDTYVKSTTHYTDVGWAYFATNPSLLLTGDWQSQGWGSADGVYTNQRFHIDLGSTKIVKRIYYENFHHSGTLTYRGVQNFTFWGSNTGAGTFDDLVYGNDEGWTELTVSQNTFDEHSEVDEADPKYITVTNTTAYRYYAFKFADVYAGTAYMGVRRIELQTEKEAIYHVSRDGWVINANTSIYMYYDKDHADNTTYIGAINTVAGAAVWDGNFKFVCHMVDDNGNVDDSTSNNNDGTKLGAGEPAETAGKVGQGQYFDGDNDRIDLASSIVIGTNCTIEAIVYLDVNDIIQTVFSDCGSGDNRGYVFYVHEDELRFLGSDDGTGARLANRYSTNANLAATTYYHVAAVKSNTSLTFYKDGESLTDDGGTIYSSYADSSFPTQIGIYNDVTKPFDGKIDEKRYSDTNRSAAWMKGTKNTLWDDLFTYGSEEIAEVEVNALFFGANF